MATIQLRSFKELHFSGSRTLLRDVFVFANWKPHGIFRVEPRGSYSVDARLPASGLISVVSRFLGTSRPAGRVSEKGVLSVKKFYYVLVIEMTDESQFALTNLK